MPSSSSKSVSKKTMSKKIAGKAAKAPLLFAVRHSKIHGKGAFSLTTIRKGTRLIEYVGRRIPESLADEVYAEEDGKPSHTFLFALENGDVIDATVGGNSSRWINHSCAPNCEAVGEDDEGEEELLAAGGGGGDRSARAALKDAVAAAEDREGAPVDLDEL